MHKFYCISLFKIDKKKKAFRLSFWLASEPQFTPTAEVRISHHTQLLVLLRQIVGVLRLISEECTFLSNTRQKKHAHLL